MIKIAIDVREVGIKRAGKGYYVFELVNHLAEIDRENEYFLYTDKIFNWDLPANFHLSLVPGKSIVWQRNLAKKMISDQISVYLSTLSYLGVIFAKIPTVMVVHDLAVFYAPVKSRRKSVITEKLTLRRASNKAKRILVISETTRKELTKFNPKLRDKIEVTLMAASDRFGQYSDTEVGEAREKLGLTNNYILSVGTIEPRKNYQVLIEAYAKLPLETQDKYDLVIAGKKGWYYDQVFNIIKQLKLADKVKFLDYVSDEMMPLLYSGASLFAFPSTYEGFGMPVVEALKSGVPTVIGQAEAVVEVGGEAVESANTADPDDLARKIVKVLNDKPYADSLRHKGYSQVQNYSWLRSAKRTLEVLTDVAKNNNKK